MVVACNGGEFDTRVDQKVNKGRLHLGLTRLEVVATNESAVLLCKLDGTWNEGVLRRTVDERSVFEDGRNSNDSRRSDLLVARLDCLHEFVGSVIDALQDVGVPLRVGSPLHDDFIEAISSLEVA